jgi:hypothetical protein
MKVLVLLPTILSLLSTNAWSEVNGVAKNEFQSPYGITERCVVHRMPGVNYKKSDSEKESEFCSVDLYDGKHAMCAKTWSTSPGTIIYNIEKTGLGVAQAEDRCSDLNNRKIEAADKIAKFKSTMNASGTSGTYSQASLVYYHFSRYFRSLIEVPVAVYRTIDKDQHLNRVSLQSYRTGKMGGMMKAAWDKMVASEKNPESYSPADEMFTADRRQIYGIMVNGGGARYGKELNGVRSKWGIAQNKDFIETAPYLALRHTGDLATAIANGIRKARGSSALNVDMGKEVSDVQVMFWMRELTEITLLDYIFSQQDRIGNIDYRWYWVYIAEGQLKAKRDISLRNSHGDELPRKSVDFDRVQPPAEIAQFNPVLIQGTHLNDNDAGVKKVNPKTNSPYVNYTKAAGMLETIRRYPASLYRRLIDLVNDLESQDEVYQWMLSSFDMDSRYVENSKVFAKEALQILQQTCERGEMKFDVEPAEFLATGSVQEKNVNCKTGEIQ